MAFWFCWNGFHSTYHNNSSGRGMLCPMPVQVLICWSIFFSLFFSRSIMAVFHGIHSWHCKYMLDMGIILTYLDSNGKKSVQHICLNKLVGAVSCGLQHSILVVNFKNITMSFHGNWTVNPVPQLTKSYGKDERRIPLFYVTLVFGAVCIRTSAIFFWVWFMVLPYMFWGHIIGQKWSRVRVACWVTSFVLIKVFLWQEKLKWRNNNDCLVPHTQHPK